MLGALFLGLVGPCVLSALIGTIIVLVIATLVFRRTASRPSFISLPWRQASGHDLRHTVIGGGI